MNLGQASLSVVLAQLAWNATTILLLSSSWMPVVEGAQEGITLEHPAHTQDELTGPERPAFTIFRTYGS